MSSYDAVIIGAGAAGLVAAKELEGYKLKTLVIDAAPQVGGRLRTDNYDGYLLDHGFQVLLTAYPMVKKHLNLNALRLKTFASGAQIFGEMQFFKVSDSPWMALRMLFSPVGTFGDKLKMARLRKMVLSLSIEEVFEIKEEDTLSYLKAYGFSEKIINRFFKPFFGGIFLEHELRTSARQFLFIFKMFAEGKAALPAKGMAEIAFQLKSQLKKTEFRLNSKVERLEKGKVILEGGGEIQASQIIVATEPGKILPQLEGPLQWNQTLQAYFIGPEGKFSSDFISLSFGKESIINNIACLSKVQPKYAKQSKQLYSVSFRKSLDLTEKELQLEVQQELQDYIGPEASRWVLIRSYHIKQALPVVDSVVYERAFEETRLSDGIYLAGDYLLNPSLNAAMLSGELAAKALILNHQPA